ncbi:hypothetical protein RCM47_05405 [Escherichia coli]|nr:hypothetical protein [Escherichia coli]
MDFSASVNVAKQCFELVNKAIRARDQKVIEAALNELQSRITELQMLNAELSGLYFDEKQITVKLRAEQRKFEEFVVDVRNYSLFTTPGGSTVYRSQTPDRTVAPPHYLCPHCHGNYNKSVLQPEPEVTIRSRFSVFYCPRCHNKYLMDEKEPVSRKSHPAGRLPR